MNTYAKFATVGFRFLAVVILLSGVPTLLAGTPMFALSSAIAATALYVASRPLGMAIARDLD